MIHSLNSKLDRVPIIVHCQILCQMIVVPSFAESTVTLPQLDPFHVFRLILVFLWPVAMEFSGHYEVRRDVIFLLPPGVGWGDEEEDQKEEEDGTKILRRHCY
ncbi:hypothetical protein GCK72_016090 [Caenorhabditis remanei]|uniref:Uncharacterized protein n=1 Tax=Caenorhabditis remanei TaxID=31234 RepID=A0A6A5GYZ2_CAERE|nr:hypothetical protein GCK72_016090 [Caenorhabditis remanei]KAF1759623.1 hypothetical protein GCK72_016090 [Caenorhabditis remanei]